MNQEIERQNNYQIPSIRKSIEPPMLAFKQFNISILTEDRYKEAFECFIEGYQKAHPFFKAIGATKQDLITIFQDKFRQSFDERPLQQFIAIDTQNNNKIIGVYLTTHFVDLKENEQKNILKQLIKNQKSDVAFTKYRYDCKLQLPEILKPFEEMVEMTQNPLIYQMSCISILPQYLKYGLFIKMLDLNFYTCKHLGVKGSIDLIYNKVTGNASIKLGNGKVLKDLDIMKETHNGEYVFKDDLCRGQLIYSQMQTDYIKNCQSNEKLFGQWYQQAELYNIQQNKISKYANLIDYSNTMNVLPKL